MDTKIWFKNDGIHWIIYGFIVVGCFETLNDDGIVAEVECSVYCSIILDHINVDVLSDDDGDSDGDGDGDGDDP
ncbi:hypothetical protein QR98_0041920 [Sarcoptes scabiei]|uniref:Uncharacterized protein n=1 Tax=Sarcoptes scabiei TaxID=52283 RepID=A0A132A444_SARSC|nr:hypothetical protein QR98_0041920 [Sarcoptes scabiei]